MLAPQRHRDTEVFLRRDACASIVLFPAVVQRQHPQPHPQPAASILDEDFARFSAGRLVARRADIHVAILDEDFAHINANRNGRPFPSYH